MIYVYKSGVSSKLSDSRGTILSYKETRAFLVSKKPGGCEWVVWILEWNSFTLQRSPSSSGDTFRNLQWTPETVDSAEPLCIHYFPSYTHTPFQLKEDALYGSFWHIRIASITILCFGVLLSKVRVTLA